MVVSALARGGGALALGVVLGTMLALLGAGRLWLRAPAAAPTSGERPARTAAPGRQRPPSAPDVGRAREGLKRGSERARRADLAVAGRARAVRDHAQRGRLGDLLLARRRRRPRARAHAARLPARRALLRGHDGHLRRGQLAAPRARRRLDVRPLRLRRALELRRRLGDPARLPDRDGDRRGRHLGVPRASSGASSTTAASEP